MSSARATSFGAWAEEYDRWRPSYPGEAVDWLLPADATRVAEVGAGTGKLTDRLVERGLDVDVVEPDSRMLALLGARYPGLRTHVSTVTSLPIGDASVDSVLVADAWHWFPRADAAAEVSRVLRPGGWLGCVWNVPAPTHAWQWPALRLDPALTVPNDQDALDRLGLSTGRAESTVVRWTWRLTPEEWRGFVSTVSHVALLPDDERTGVLEEVEREVSRACSAAGTNDIPLDHDALCVRWHPD